MFGPKQQWNSAHWWQSIHDAGIVLTGHVRGYIVRRVNLTRQNRAFVGSLKECRPWITGYQQALADKQTATASKVTLTVVP